MKPIPSMVVLALMSSCGAPPTPATPAPPAIDRPAEPAAAPVKPTRRAAAMAEVARLSALANQELLLGEWTGRWVRDVDVAALVEICRSFNDLLAGRITSTAGDDAWVPSRAIVV